MFSQARSGLSGVNRSFTAESKRKKVTDQSSD